MININDFDELRNAEYEGFRNADRDTLLRMFLVLQRGAKHQAIQIAEMKPIYSAVLSIAEKAASERVERISL